MKKKYALVTGGTRGIGRAICLKLAEMGYNLLINYVSNEEKARSVLDEVKEHGVDAELFKFDVGNDNLVDETLSQWIENNPDKEIEVLVNNAGIRKDRLLMGMERSDWNAVIDTNVKGFYNVTKNVIRGMVLKRYGRIINVVSEAGVHGGFSGQTNYSASKAAIIGATKTLAKEVGRKNITVNAIAPGFITTEMIEDIDEKMYSSHIPLKRFGKPEEVAELVGFMASPRSSYISGQVISINGGGMF